MTDTPKTDRDITAELAKLRARKAELDELMSLQEQVNAMEVRMLLGKQSLTVIARNVVTVVCAHFSLAPTLLTSRVREEHIAWPRQIAYHLVRLISAAPYAAIGKVFQRDHGTILQGCARVRARAETEPKVAETLLELEAQCRCRLKEEEPSK